MKGASTGLAFICGALLALSGSPWNWWWVAPLALALLFRLTARRRWRQRLLTGWVAAVVLLLISLSWTRQYSIPGFLLLSAAEALFMAVAVAAVPARGRRRAPIFVAALFLAEAIRIRWPLGGLPMGGITTGQVSGPLAQAASVIGEPGIVALLALVAVAISEIPRVRPTRALVGWGAAACALALVVAGHNINVNEGPTISVATVQAGGPQALLREEQDPLGVFNNHYLATEDVPSGTELIVWPENVVTTAHAFKDSAYQRALAELAIEHHATLLVGVVESEGERFHNSVVVFDPDGDVIDEYEKLHRVPFGEYVPARSVFERFVDLSQVPHDAFEGSGHGDVSIGNGRQVGVAISFEGLFAERARDAIKHGGQLLAIPTNAASYKSSNVAKAQVQAARFRAIETRRWVTQSAPTGISVIVDERGRIKAESTIGPAAVLSSQAQLATGLTPYVRWGDAPLIILSSAVLFLAAIASARTKWEDRSGRREQDPDPQGDAQTESY